MNKKLNISGILYSILFLMMGITAVSASPPSQINTNPPAEPVKLIFIHHSCGENLLTDGNGDLGRTLADNNYFVSDSNYGWGPDGIGDRTDITDWPEWFVGPDSGHYMDAVFNESGQNAEYTRTFADPGGENEIIMFKSCFPNSNLEGSPDDPPQRGDGLTVGNAKAIYNELLIAFAAHPDKLFIAVTAPPVQDYSYAHNARAFNRWLATEWLQGYEGSNVAVFDFYNVLTGVENHHRIHDGAIQYITDQGEDVHAYPSDDNHPSRAGNQKATAEFVPLLNYYYHHWMDAEAAPQSEETVVEAADAEEATDEEATDEAAVDAEVASEPETVEEAEPAAEVKMETAVSAIVFDNFDDCNENWQADAAEESMLTCREDTGELYSDSTGMYINYDVAEYSWANCNRINDTPQDLSGKDGLTFFLHAKEIGQIIFTGFMEDANGELLIFEYYAETTEEAIDGWQQIDLSWAQLVEPEWQGSGLLFDPAAVRGIALAFNGDNGRNQGELWVDEIRFLSDTPAPEIIATEAAPVEEASPVAIEQPEEEEDEGDSGRFALCPTSMTMGLMAMVAAVWVTTSGKRHRS